MTIPQLGIYEKAFSSQLSWEERLTEAAALGFDFLEMAVDPGEERLQRLDWAPAKRAALRRACRNTGIPIFNIVLSAHRTYPLGSASADTRRKALDVLKKAIALAVDLDIPVIQIAGYFVFEEPGWPRARSHFENGLRIGAEWALGAGVQLGLENMDGADVISVETAVELIRQIDSPSLRLYPDLGNLAANGFDVCTELAKGKDWLVGVHLKDTRPGQFRRVPFGQGVVPFAAVFAQLHEMNYRGPFTLEMWNDDAPDANQMVCEARDWIFQQMKLGGLKTSSKKEEYGE